MMSFSLRHACVVSVLAALVGSSASAQRPEVADEWGIAGLQSPGTVAATERPASDLDEDCDVDLEDHAQMAREFTGPLDGCCVSNRDCLNDEYCQKAPDDCGGFGECVARPSECPPTQSPVCGCDGQTYLNRCRAAQVGVNPHHEGACRVDVCELPPAVGPCDAAIIRWYFNSNSGACERFVYGGCGGNLNNFLSLEACEDHCRPIADCRNNQDCPDSAYCAHPIGECDGVGRCITRPQECDPVLDPVCGCDGETYRNAVFAGAAGISIAHEGPCEQRPCTLPIEPGPCRAYIPRFAFNAVTNQCERFIYGGCGGNANNFGTLQACIDACTEEIPCRSNGDCPQNMACSFKPGACGLAGFCVARPEACPDIYDPVCGCDDRTYNNPCRALASGVAIASEGPCEESVCDLPTDPGPCRAVFERFSYNSMTDRCEPFIYGGCGGNANNFPTLQQCIDACVPERPCGSATACNNGEFCDNGLGGCGDNGVCRPRPIDCPRVWDPVCGCDRTTYANRCAAHQAGVNVNHAGACSGDTCRLPIEPGPCRGAFPRYAYDNETGQCVRFIYGGCGGNANNYPTLDDCLTACREPDVCQLPLDPGPCDGAFPRYGFDASVGRCVDFTYGGCEGNANNFDTLEECEASCPAQDPCDQPIVSGDCQDVIARYGFNRQLGECVRFVYTGCGGNANNFESVEACQETCAPVDVCDQPIVVGPCEGLFPRFAFDQSTGRCERFFYGGCGANGNNFPTREECEQRCAPRDRCNLPVVVGPCSSFTPIFRWAYDPVGDVCTEFLYSGCGGNANNFESQAHCQRACDENTCFLPPQMGPCRAVIQRYYYNPQTQACEVFIYGGCGGNANNFTSLDECARSCGG